MIVTRVKQEEIKNLLSKSISEWKLESDKEAAFSRYNLDDAVAGQSQKYINWSKLYAVANYWKHKCEEQVENIKAKKDLDIRKNYEDYDLTPDRDGKLREGHIKSIIRRDKDVRKAINNFLTAKAYDKLFEGIVSAFEQRRSMIKIMEELVLSEYKSDISVKESDIDDMRSRIAKRKKRGKRREKL